MTEVSIEDTVGYFAWVRSTRGTVAPEKYDAQRRTLNPEAKHAFERITITSYRLDAELWKLSLDELAKKFPPPPNTYYTETVPKIKLSGDKEQ